MAPRTSRLILVLLAVLTVAGELSPLYSQPGERPSFADVVRAAPNQASQDRADMALLETTGNELMDRSATFADMIVSLKSFRGVLLYLRPASLDGLLGRGRYAIGGERLTGVIEINAFRVAPHLRVRALAHELAHAYEIGCLARTGDTSAVRRVLSRRGSNGRRSQDIETRFAQAMEVTVVREYFNRSAARSRLAELSITHGVSPCGATEPLYAAASQ